MKFLQSVRALVARYITSEDIPLEGRIFNVIAGICTVFIVLNGLAVSESKPLYAVLLLVAVTLFTWVNRTGRFRVGSLLFVGITVFIVFPYLFLDNDGVSGGMILYFLFGAVILCMLLKGITCLVTVTIYLLSMVGWVALDYRARTLGLDLIKPFPSEMMRYFDVAISLVICGGALGLIIKFQDAQYRKAMRRAEDASRAKSEFLANMSHEIRTPMNAIIGMTAIAKATEDPERKDYALGKIEEASAHLLGVINDILDMSKIEANKLTLSSVLFQFEKLLQKTTDVIAFRVDEKHQEFSVYIDKNIPDYLVGDDQRLAQVIANLLSNAVKFTPERGRIHLDARLLEEKNAVCTLQIEVSDNGIGISQEQQTRLFTSFEQAEGSTSRQFGGTGLGLAISKRIVEMMGGHIGIRSEIGQGATFTFTAQLKRGAQTRDAQEDFRAGALRRENPRLLVVDDTPVVLEYFRDVAQQYHLSCDTAAGGEEALALIREKGDYDLYFIDWNMPEMNGIELSRQIRTRCAGKPVIIMISAVEWSSIEEAARAAGVDQFLTKPLFPSAILDCISEHALAPSGGAQGPGLAKGSGQDTLTDCFLGRRILLAEDVEINREIVMALLEPTGVKIDWAENGLAAVRRFQEDPAHYDIILMDVQMPEVDGYEATRRIRALPAPEAREIPIVAMTANVFREDVEKCLQAGMSDHVGKPLDFDETIRTLRKYLAGARTGAGTRLEP